MRSWPSRAILVLHRYLGVVVGVLMTVWCLSGFVMMYQGYPNVSEEEHLASLERLDLSGPLALDDLPVSDDEEIRRFQIEMLADTPVLRIGGGRGGRRGDAGVYDLQSGEPLAELSVGQVTALARQYAVGNGLDLSRAAAPVLMQSADQWTIQSFRAAQPLYRVDLHDGKGTELYISGANGTVVQDTNRTERALNWLGAIPHWLYPTALRQNGPLWTQVVIWTSVFGSFLTVTGLYVGVGRLMRRKGRISPYRGLWYWHHMLGLALGVLTLTWVFSGLLTMGPWGLLSGSPNNLRQEIAGTATWADAREFIEEASRNGLPENTVRLSPAVLGGQFHTLAYLADGSTVRLGGQAHLAPLTASEVRSALDPLPVGVFEYMTEEDAYHYSFKDRKAAPVYRAILSDGEQTRIYIDAATGQVSRVVDNAARQSRWLVSGLHSLDFIRGRPMWDVLTLLLLAGVTAVCATGAWMSVRRARRDIKMIRRRQGRKGRAARLSGRAAVVSRQAEVESN